MNTMTKTAAIAEGFAEMVEDSEVVIAEEAGDEMDFDMTPFCEVCGRVTCHVGEHEDLYEAGLVDYNLGGWVGLVSWRKGVTHEQIEAWRFYAALAY